MRSEVGLGFQVRTEVGLGFQVRTEVGLGFQVRTEVGLKRAGFPVKNEVQEGQGSRLELKVRKDMDAVVWADGQQGLVFR